MRVAMYEVTVGLCSSSTISTETSLRETVHAMYEVTVGLCSSLTRAGAAAATSWLAARVMGAIVSVGS
ncbi:hypothetical protein RTBOTA2_006115 [Rhodotorula toruloides]|nr:hypothetical protein RTBOTA2_006115 [Rhodotorula toruloides]